MENDCESLDLRNQNLKSIPNEVFLQRNLRELHVKEGNNIQDYQLFMLLDSVSTIQLIDSQDVSTMRRGIASINKIILRRLEEMFLSKAACEIFSESSNEETRIGKMVQLAKNTIKAGPTLLEEYKNYKLEQFIEENYDKFVSDALEMQQQERGPPQKKTRKSAKGRKGKTTYNASTLSKLVDSLKLSWNLQTHSKNNSPEDHETKVWMCEFAPSLTKLGTTSSTLATCGGDSICIIDCDTGTVQKKYKELNEQFYCLTWSVLTTSATTSSNLTNQNLILAVAGILGEVKLIDTEKLLCYDGMMVHRKPVDALMFHTRNAHWLFSGSEDGTIVMWELACPFILDAPFAKCLLSLEVNKIVRQVAICPHGNVVFGACDDGLYSWNIKIKSHSLSPSYKFKFKEEPNIPLDSANCLSNHLIAIKRVQEGTILVYKSDSQFLKDDARLFHCIQWRKTKTPFLKFNYQPGCRLLTAGDDQGKIWLYDLSDIEKKEKRKVNFEKLVSLGEYTKMFNHVTCSNPPRHVVGVADRNAVVIWKCG